MASELRKLGVKVRRDVKVGNWKADFVIETPSKGTFVIEVKNRKIGIPDVLSVASIANNLSYPLTSFSGSIATTIAPSEPVWQVAADNNIAIIIFSRDPEDLRLKTSFINLVAEIEVLGRKLSGLKPGRRVSFKQIIDNLNNSHVINETLHRDLMYVWEIRNKMVHGQSISQSELHDAIKRADSILIALHEKMP